MDLLSGVCIAQSVVSLALLRYAHKTAKDYRRRFEVFVREDQRKAAVIEHLTDVVNNLTEEVSIGDYSTSPLPFLLREEAVWDRIKSTPIFERKGKPRWNGSKDSFQMLTEVSCLDIPIQVFINYKPMPLGILYAGPRDKRIEEYGTAANREGIGKIFVLLDNDDLSEEEARGQIALLDGVKDLAWGRFANIVEFMSYSNLSDRT